MKTWTVAAALLFVSASGLAQTTPTPLPHKSCDDLKAEISKKLDAKGAVGYTLDAVEKGREGGGKVVGSCDGGTKSLDARVRPMKTAAAIEMVGSTRTAATPGALRSGSRGGRSRPRPQQLSQRLE